jgi:hypothetical protein
MRIWLRWTTVAVVAMVGCWWWLAEPTSALAYTHRVFFSEATLVKQAIISNAVLANSHPQLDGDAAYQKHSASVYDLLVLFDAMHTRESLQTLVSLNSYYLGESFGEMKECVVLRKGHLILPYLLVQLGTKDDECIQELGKTSPQLCLGRKEYHDEVMRLVGDIRLGERCSDEDLRNTFGF